MSTPPTTETTEPTPPNVVPETADWHIRPPVDDFGNAIWPFEAWLVMRNGWGVVTPDETTTVVSSNAAI